MAITSTTAVRYGIGLTTNAAGYAISMVAQIILARLMGVAGYGLLALALSLVLLPASVADLGVAASTPRFLAISLGEGRPDRIPTIIRKSAIFTTIVALLLAGIMLWLAPHIAAWMKMSALASPLTLFAAFIPGIYLQRWCLSVLKGLGRNTTQITLESSVLQVFIFGFAIGHWFAFGSIEAVVLGYGLAYVSAALIGLYCVICTLRSMPDPGTHGPFQFWEIIRHGIPLNITALAQRIFRRCDILIIGALVGESGVGLYRAATTLASGTKKLISPINSFAVFRMSKSVGHRRIDAAVRHYSNVTLFSLSIALPVYLIIFLFAEEIMTLLYTVEYASAAPILKILTIGFAAFVSVGPMGALFNAIGKNWVRMWVVIAMSVLNITLNVVLIKWLGVIGAAYSTTLSFVILYILFNFYVKNVFLGYRSDYTPMLLLLFTGLIGVAVEFLPLDALGAKVVVTFASALIVFAVGMVMMFHSYPNKLNKRVHVRAEPGQQDYFARELNHETYL